MLYWKKSGEGLPVVLLHGLFGSGDNLGPLARALAESMAVYQLDLPAHGRSDTLAQLSLDAMAAAVLAWLDAQALQQVVLVGHSLGGKVAMQLALRFPQRVAGLVVADIAPVSYPPHHRAVLAGLNAVQRATLASRAEAERILADYIAEPPVRQFLLKSLYRRDATAFSWRFDLAAIERDYAQLLSAPAEGLQFAGPCLFIKGELSDYIVAEHRALIQRYFPAAEFKMLQGVGHWLHAEKPQLFNALVSRFLHALASSD